jgi:hypothetical protein
MGLPCGAGDELSSRQGHRFVVAAELRRADDILIANILIPYLASIFYLVLHFYYLRTQHVSCALPALRGMFRALVRRTHAHPDGYVRLLVAPHERIVDQRTVASVI